MAIPSGNKTNQKLVQELASLRQRIGQLEATPPIHGSATSETTGSLGLGPAYHELDVGLCLFDLDLRFLYINTWLAALNGLSVDDHVGQIIDDVLPGVAGNVGPQLRHVIESGESIVGGFVETETPARPGEIRVFEHSYHPVRSDDGTIDGLACVVEEITERRKDGDLGRRKKRSRIMFSNEHPNWRLLIGRC